MLEAPGTGSLLFRNDPQYPAAECAAGYCVRSSVDGKLSVSSFSHVSINLVEYALSESQGVRSDFQEFVIPDK